MPYDIHGADMNICIGIIDVRIVLMLTPPISRFHDAKNLNCLLKTYMYLIFDPQLTATVVPALLDTSVLV